MVKRELTQDWSVAHGGAVTSLIDSAVGIALVTMLGSRDLIATVELKVNFLAPAKLGLVKVIGRIIHKGKSIAVGEAEVKDPTGKLIAKGLVTYLVLGNRGGRKS